MTMTEEIFFPAATSEDSHIVPEGRWTLELLRIEDAPPSTYKPEDGRRFKWVFALTDGPDVAPGQRFEFNGEPYEFFRFTTRKNSPRANARIYAEALMGQKFADGYVPTVRDMIGRRMSGVVAYQDSSFTPGQEVCTLISLRPVEKTPPVTRPAAARAVTQISADATDADVDRALVVSSLQKSVENLLRLDPASGANAKTALDASDLETAPLADLQSLLDSVKAAVAASLAA